MRFRFIGNGKDDPAAVTLWGLSFPIGDPVEVEDPAHIAKLQGNSHFETVKGRPRAKDDA